MDVEFESLCFFSTQVDKVLQPFEDGNAFSYNTTVVPIKEEVRQALDLAMHGLEIHTKDLDGSEYSVVQNISRSSG